MRKTDGKYTRPRVLAALALLTALTLASGLNLLRQSVGTYRTSPETDPVTVHERRIEQVRAVLPEAAAVGYVTSVDNDRIFLYERTLRNVEFLAQYMLTQYTLAPRIVHNSPDRPLVVGNYIGGPPDPDFLKRRGLVPLRDFGDGLVLYRKGPGP